MKFVKAMSFIVRKQPLSLCCDTGNCIFEGQQKHCKNNMNSGGSLMEVLKVSARSYPNSVAGAIASVMREHDSVEVQAVGAGASNQAIKAIAIARGYLAPIGVDLICYPAFANIVIDGENRTAIRLICEKR